MEERRKMVRPKGASGKMFKKRKSEIDNDISEELGLSRAVVASTTAAFVRHIGFNLREGNNVAIKDLGSFRLHYMLGRRFYDGVKRETYQRAAHFVVKFKVSSILQKEIRKVKIDTMTKWKKKMRITKNI